jgi:gluconokinase
VVVAVDVGTTEVKAAAFAVVGPDGDAPPPVVTTVALVTHHPEPGRAEQDPGAVLAAVADALGRCLTATRDRFGADVEVAALSVTTAMHALVGVDDVMVPCTPLVTWADERATAEVLAHRAADPGGDLPRHTGTPHHPMTPRAKLAWWSHHHPEVVDRVRWWLGLKDWVLWWLTGEVVTERSSAGGTGLCSLATGTWDPEAVAMAGVDATCLPPVRQPTEVFDLRAGLVAELGLSGGALVVLGAADGPVSNLGVGATQPGSVAVTVGTSVAVRAVVERPLASGDGSLFCYPLALDRWVVGGALGNGGSVLDWVGRTVAGGADLGDLLDAAAAVTPGADGLVVLPFLAPERAPLWEPDRTGAVLGLRPHHGPAHVARAAVEGVGLQIGALARRVQAATELREVRASGGALRHPLWRQVLAAGLRRPVRVVGDVTGTALGAAALGWCAVGGAADLEAARADLVGAGEGIEVVMPDAEAVAATDRTARRLAAVAADLTLVAAGLDRGGPDPGRG